MSRSAESISCKCVAESYFSVEKAKSGTISALSEGRAALFIFLCFDIALRIESMYAFVLALARVFAVSCKGIAGTVSVSVAFMPFCGRANNACERHIRMMTYM